MTEETKECLEWIREKYGISFALVPIPKGKTVVDLVLEWYRNKNGNETNS